MAVVRACSECKAPIGHRSPKAITCSKLCRNRRERRLRREARAEVSFDLSSIANDKERTGMVKQALNRELAPVVRAALTEDTMRAIRDLLELAPAAVAGLTEDLSSDDAVIRQRAYQLWFKYTVGHPAIVSKDEDAGSQIVVNFGLPRPGDPGVVDSTADDAEEEYVEPRQCSTCSQVKPADEFVQDSDRCQSCDNELRRKVLERIGAYT